MPRRSSPGVLTPRPRALCPECAPKVWWACRAGPAQRYRALADFCARAGLKPQAEFYEKSLQAVEAR